MLTVWSRCFHKWQRAVTLHYGLPLTLSMSPLLHDVLPLFSRCVLVQSAEVDDVDVIGERETDEDGSSRSGLRVKKKKKKRRNDVIS